MMKGMELVTLELSMMMVEVDSLVEARSRMLRVSGGDRTGDGE